MTSRLILYFSYAMKAIQWSAYHTHLNKNVHCKISPCLYWFQLMKRERCWFYSYLHPIVGGSCPVLDNPIRGQIELLWAYLGPTTIIGIIHFIGFVIHIKYRTLIYTWSKQICTKKYGIPLNQRVSVFATRTYQVGHFFIS